MLFCSKAEKAFLFSTVIAPFWSKTIVYWSNLHFIPCRHGRLHMFHKIVFSYYLGLDIKVEEHRDWWSDFRIMKTMFKFRYDYEFVNMSRILLIMMNLILILTKNHGTMCVPMHIVAIIQGNHKIFFWKSKKILQGIMMCQRACRLPMGHN